MLLLLLFMAYIGVYLVAAHRTRSLVIIIMYLCTRRRHLCARRSQKVARAPYRRDIFKRIQNLCTVHYIISSENGITIWKQPRLSFYRRQMAILNTPTKYMYSQTITNAEREQHTRTFNLLKRKNS